MPEVSEDLRDFCADAADLIALFDRDYDPGRLGGAGLARPAGPAFRARIAALSGPAARLRPAPVTAGMAAGAVAGFFAERGVDLAAGRAEGLAAAVLPRLKGAGHLAAVLAALDAAWKPHWRRPCSGAKLAQIAAETPRPPHEEAALKVISIARRLAYEDGRARPITPSAIPPVPVPVPAAVSGRTGSCAGPAPGRAVP